MNQITFRDMDPIDSIRSYVEKRIEKLKTFHHHIISSRVILSAPHRHQQHGRHYRVSIEVKVPGDDLVVGNDPAERSAHEDLYAAVDEACDLMKRALKASAQKQRGEARPHGVNAQLLR